MKINIRGARVVEHFRERIAKAAVPVLSWNGWLAQGFAGVGTCTNNPLSAFICQISRLSPIISLCTKSPSVG